MPHPLPATAPQSLSTSGWDSGVLRGASAGSWGLLVAPVPAVLQRKEFLWFLSNSKPQERASSSLGGNVQCKTRFSIMNSRCLLLLQWQATKPGPLPVAEGPSYRTHGEGRGRTQLGEVEDIPSAWATSVPAAPRRLRWKHFQKLQRRGRGDLWEGAGELPALRSLLLPGASQTGLRECPTLPGRSFSWTRTAEEWPRRRGQDRPKSSAATAAGRGDPGRGGREATQRPVPRDSGGLGCPLPLQPDEMAEHVAIMPRHSGSPARPALISGPRTPLLSPCAPRKGNKTQHVSAAPAHKAPGLGLSGGQSGPSISASGPLCPSPPCHTFCSRIQ